jgi:hypothetical protein
MEGVTVAKAIARMAKKIPAMIFFTGNGFLASVIILGSLACGDHIDQLF